MFNRGITRLLEALPQFGELDQARIRRLLSNAYADALDLSESTAGDEDHATELARLALALETHAVLAPSASADTVRACAFVAAEALSLADDLRDESAPARAGPWIDARRYRQLEAGLLYLIAGYDANAAVVARKVRVLGALPDEMSGTRRYVSATAEDAVAQLRSVLMMRRGGRLAARRPPANAAPGARVRADLWRRLADAARRHTLWLRFADSEADGSARADLDELLGPLLAERAGAYADIALLARLLAMACDETGGRALRSLEDPDGGGHFGAYLEERATERPVMWPATQRYVGECLRGAGWHAAVAVPTGAGKSGVAELAVAHELDRGWALYLAPTNALVAQIQRDLEAALGGYPGFTVQGFLGGPEMTGAAEEVLPRAFDATVLVMTPEKCTLALRQAPEAFERLGLCVVDECHLIGERGTRGVLTELVVAHVLTLAPEARLLLLSALVANPEDLTAWLQTVTGQPAAAIREPWRPTRTLRTVLGFDRERFAPIHGAAEEERASAGRTRQAASAPAALLAGLQGAWQGSEPGDFMLVDTNISVPFEARPGSFYYSSNDALSAAAASLAREGHRVLAFIPRNRHWAFSVGARIDLAELANPLDAEVESQLVLAEYELGVGSQVRELLSRGVAVHTSALLEGERRASELAFVRNAAPLMLATGTMAQGLNLPATAVVIAGTQVGHDPTLTAAEQRERAKLQLLNAVGRAGRPQHATRSLAIVVPERPLIFDAAASPHEALAQVPFLADEDAAGNVQSRLVTLIDRALRDDERTADMTIEELAAFAVLPLDAPDVDAGEVIGKTFGAWARNASNRESAAVIAGSLEKLGRRFLGERPRWLAEAAYLAGLTVEQTLGLHDGFLAVEAEVDKTEIAEWVDAALRAMSTMRTSALAGIIAPETVRSTRCAAIFAPGTPDDTVRDAWQVLREATALWLSGATYDDIAALVAGPKARGREERHQRAALPRVIRVANDGFGYGLTRAVGGLLALHEVGATASEEHDRWTLTPIEKRTLELAPLAVRRGCGDLSSLGWSRFARLPRRLSHLAAGVMPIPANALDEETAALVANRTELLVTEALQEDWDITASDAAALRAWKQTVAA